MATSAGNRVETLTYSPIQKNEPKFFLDRKVLQQFTRKPSNFVIPLALASIVTATNNKNYNTAYFLVSLVAYLPCLLWGIPYSKIGSWKSIRSNGHRVGGVLTLLFPLFFALWEAITSSHVHPILYFSGIGLVLTNVGFGAALIPPRIPAYDIPTLRAFAVGVLLALSFTSLSLYFRLGHLISYNLIGKLLAGVSVYSALYAWSDGLQHLYQFSRGNYKEDIGKKWYLPFERSSLKHVFINCFYKQPEAKAMAASVSPANIVTVTTTFLTAIFATISLLQVRYLFSGSTGIQKMALLYPDIVRWSCYEALLAVVANNFGTFAGTLVLQNKVDQKTAGMFNAIGLLIPVLNLFAFLLRYTGSPTDFLMTSFARF